MTSSGRFYKVKCTLVQALRLCTGRTAHRGSRYIALLFHDHGTRVAPQPVWTGAENLAPTGIRSSDRPARSPVAIPTELPGPQVVWGMSINPLNAELNPICYLLALLGDHFLHVNRIRVKSLTLRLLMLYIYI